MLRVGILGYGYMGTIRHAALRARSDCQVVRIFHAEPSSDLPGPAATWEEVVDDPNVDCVFVCLPNHLTRNAVCRALSRGKHVFAEKPPGRSVAEVDEMIAAERQSGMTLKFGFNHRYHPAIRAAKARIDAGDLGEVLWLRGRHGKPIATDFASGWRADPRRAGGGILIDQGIHMLDLFQMLCGHFDEVQAYADARSNDAVEHDLFAIFRNSRGQLASLHSSQTQWQPLFSLEVSLDKGSVAVHGLLSRSGRYGPERLEWRERDTGPVHVETFDTDDSWALELDAFFGAIRDRIPVKEGSSRDARKLMELVAAIYDAASRAPGELDA